MDNNKSHAFENKRRQFFVGESDSEIEDNEEQEFGRKERRPSASSADSLVGFVPTAFVDDDDSGLGGMGSLEFEEDEELPRDFSAVSTNQIVPLRSVNIGGSKGPSASDEQKKKHRRRQFSEFYELKDDFLGQGAYASVQTCVELASGKEFAVKLIDRHEPGHTRSRVLREVEIFKMVRGHPNFVQLHEWFSDEDTFYLVFEKMRGGPLLKHIQRKVCFTELEASLVIRDIANALKFLHDRGIAHRDLKPENVLCTHDDDGFLPVKLCDLDLASKPSPRRSSRPLHNVQSQPDLASPVGSAEFLAPEVVDAFHHDGAAYDRRCDLWSLGVLVYILLCGYPPFYGQCSRENCGWAQGQSCNDCQENLFQRIQRGEFDFPEEEWADISDEAKELISHLLIKNARDRLTAEDVLNHPMRPRLPLHHVPSNLFRKDSSVRDMAQLNEHFQVMSRFAGRMSSRFEEAIPSANSTPEDEQHLSDALMAKMKTADLPLAPPNGGFHKFDESLATYSNQSSSDAYDEVDVPPALTEDPQEALDELQDYDPDAVCHEPPAPFMEPQFASTGAFYPPPADGRAVRRGLRECFYQSPQYTHAGPPPAFFAQAGSPMGVKGNNRHPPRSHQQKGQRNAHFPPNSSHCQLGTAKNDHQAIPPHGDEPAGPSDVPRIFEQGAPRPLKATRRMAPPHNDNLLCLSSPLG
ncbi:BMA-MNK-1, isoform u [Aphelenchoides fujianensis]|nr:BMA-MNK-1, isoform u [Aphelenchoides fujianensis]